MKRRIACLLLLIHCLGLLSACGGTAADKTAVGGFSEEEENAGMLSGHGETAADKTAVGGFSEEKKNVGIYMDDPDELRALGEQPDFLGWFEYWFGAEAKEKREFVHEHPAYSPFVSWMPTNVSLRDIAAGKHDTYAVRYLKDLAACCPDRTILIRFAHEMELRPEYGAGWYTWQYEGSEDDFKAAWIHLYELSREFCPQAKWIWAPNRVDEYAAPFYPGDEYVDYVGVTLNHRGDQRYTYSCFEDFYILEATRDALEAYGKKIIGCEVAYSGADEEIKANYLKSVFTYMKTDPNLVAVCLFNENKAPQRQFRFTDSDICLQRYNEGVRELRDEA